MSADNIWFPLYLGDYFRDTMHLSCIQHGAYDLLMFSYYNNRGPLEDNNEVLARICKLTLSDWSAMRPAVTKFFKIGGGLWRHKRADFEIEKMKNLQAARVKGAMSTNRKLGRTPSDTLTDTPSERSAIRSGGRSRVGISESESESDAQTETNSKKDILAGASSAHQTFIKNWCDNYEAAHQCKYHVAGARDGKAVKELLKMGILAIDLLEIAKKAWQIKFNPFLLSQSQTIHGFQNNFNQIQAFLKNPNGNQNSKGNNYVKPNHDAGF